VRLYREPDLLSEMSVAARRRVELLGGWDDYGARVIALFNLLADRDTPRYR
jgi:hypothetical protein